MKAGGKTTAFRQIGKVLFHVALTDLHPEDLGAAEGAEHQRMRHQAAAKTVLLLAGVVKSALQRPAPGPAQKLN